ncbi:PIG-L family deacetylase [Rhodococcus rhodnii]|uniref:PIG-L family deacetylase n=2 Tax=Rhodococcus rhodnii TaxID=38312 RepID=A0A6P2CEI7_9NOCA|nr:PIG-L family deacetylase [Rhodococcus rhodnii]EOM78339.1 putative GPI deacetylase [Rhodococcus rhodnii LMG 5362]TXG91177.1 PIG-L family deacetylase [Rhodococcus rhodnii]
MSGDETRWGSARLAATPSESSGTPASVWARLVPPPLDTSDCPGAVVVAPHPDDEVLGVGGLAALLAAAGVSVRTVAVTDGDASHPGSPTWSRDRLVRARIGESQRAAAHLGLDPPRRLGLPDGDVGAHEARLTEEIAGLLRPGWWCLTTWRGDGHPDHEATGRASARAARSAGARLLEFPIWAWHWGTPDDPHIPWGRARAVELPPDVHAAKRRAIDEFVTQTAPLSEDPADRAILPPHILERFLGTRETVFVS